MKPYIADPDFTLYVGDVREVLAELPDESVHCVVTSPPYWGLRDYGVDAQLGLEETPQLYVESMVGVFHEIRRVLSKWGTVWLNMGDSYSGATASDTYNKGFNDRWKGHDHGSGQRKQEKAAAVRHGNVQGLKTKDLVGVPWRLALALQDDGWWLRSDIVWSKPNPMPESVSDRPTKSHEYIFLLTKSKKYFFDQEAVREPAEWARWGDQTVPKHEGTDTKVGWMQPKTKAELQRKASVHRSSIPGGRSLESEPSGGRNIRSVWEIPTQPFPGTHFAVFPEELPRRCLLAGCSEHVCATCGKPRERIVETAKTFESGSGRSGRMPTGKQDLRQSETNSTPDVRMGPVVSTRTVGFTDCGHDNYQPGVVLDPFLGSGTTALVARKLSRRCIGIELNAEYAAMAAARLSQLSLLAS